MSGALLDAAAAASRAGIKTATVYSYRTRGAFPAPDEVLYGRTPVWRPETIDAWLASRPGRTGRPRKETR